MKTKEYIERFWKDGYEIWRFLKLQKTKGNTTFLEGMKPEMTIVFFPKGIKK